MVLEWTGIFQDRYSQKGMLEQRGGRWVFKVYNNEIIQIDIEITWYRRESMKRSQRSQGMGDMQKLVAMSLEGF